MVFGVGQFNSVICIYPDRPPLGWQRILRQNWL